MPMYALSSSILRTLSTPASALYAPCRQSSKLVYEIVKPSTPPAAFFWSTANLTPFEVDWPPTVQVGKSEPILSVPLPPAPPPTPPITCRPLPNSSRGESAPAASAATWDGRTATPRQSVNSEAPSSQVEPGRGCSIR